MTRFDVNLYNPDFIGETEIRNSDFPEDFDISFLLPQSFLGVPFWLDLLTSLGEVAYTEINQPINALAYVRVPESQSRVFKALHASMMGYPIKDDFMTDAGYDRLNNNVGEYLYIQGADDFVCFLGYVLGIKIGLVRLWTKDYETFVVNPGANVIFNGGEYYPTTHVGIVYDTNDMVSSTMPLAEADLIDLFYEKAPLDLVLKWIGMNTTVLLGTLYVSMLNIPKTSYKFYVDARGDFNLLMNFQTSAVHYSSFQSEVLVARSDIQFYINAMSCDKSWQIDPLAGSGIIWDKSKPLPATAVNSNALRVRRSTNAWVFTGIGAGEWVTPDTIRVNHDPATGVELGILLEPTANNYVRQSTKIGTAPWEINGTPTQTYVNPGMDGELLTTWQGNGASDSVSQQVWLLPGVYTAQIVLEVESGSTAPHINILSNPTVTFTGSTYPANDTSITYPIVSTVNFGTQAVLGGTWHIATAVLTITENTLIDVVIPFNGSGVTTSIFYVGIEDGSVNSSFIPTNDCNIGLREEDILYLNTPSAPQGSIAYSSTLNNFTNTGAPLPTVNGTEVIMTDSYGVVRSQITTGATLASTVSASITDYTVGNSANPVTTVHPTGSDPTANAETPSVYFTWDSTAGGFGVNGVEYTFTSNTMEIVQTRIGPGWFGHVITLFTAPVSMTASQLNLVNNAALLSLMP